jgi:hypothetical protein
MAIDSNVGRVNPSEPLRSIPLKPCLVRRAWLFQISADNPTPASLWHQKDLQALRLRLNALPNFPPIGGMTRLLFGFRGQALVQENWSTDHCGAPGWAAGLCSNRHHHTIQL